jgi:hypothetical protein
LFAAKVHKKTAVYTWRQPTTKQATKRYVVARFFAYVFCVFDITIKKN